MWNKKSKNIRLTKAVRNCCGGLTSETQKKIDRQKIVRKKTTKTQQCV
jgi:hypothetical protein